MIRRYKFEDPHFFKGEIEFTNMAISLLENEIVQIRRVYELTSPDSENKK
jgi:hypothetical protein